MGDVIFDGVSEVERLLKTATSKGNVSLAEYVDIVDGVADSTSCPRKDLHEAVREQLGQAFGIEPMEAREAPGPRR